MKHIREFNFWPFKKKKPVRSFVNDVFMDVNSNTMCSEDVSDIKDLFIPLADEFGISLLKTKDIGSRVGHANQHQYQVILSSRGEVTRDDMGRNHLVPKKSNIVKLITPIKPNNNDGDKESFRNSMFDFLERVRNIGYKCHIWCAESLSCYVVTIWND